MDSSFPKGQYGRGGMSIASPTVEIQPSGRPAWKDALAPYARPHVGRSIVDILTSVVPYLALSVAMYFLLDVSYLLVLLVAIPAAGFLLRTYILFHDCTHGSFLPTKKANMWLGITLGLVVWTPFYSWRHAHQVHHATSGDLDRRGEGDVPTWTVAEYYSAGFWGRLGYRLFRNPLVMFGIGPLWALVIQPRLVSLSARPRLRNSVYMTNLALVVLVGLLIFWIGLAAFILIWLPPVMLAGAAG